MRNYVFEGDLPLIPVELTVSDALGRVFDRQLEMAPAPVRVSALVDSGASVTVIRPELVEQLRLRQKGDCKIGGISEEARVYPNYDVGLSILDEFGKDVVFRIGDMQAVSVPLSTPGIDMLLGRDVLQHFEFTLAFRDHRISMREV